MDAGHVLPQEPCKVKQGKEVIDCIMHTQTSLKFTKLHSITLYHVKWASDFFRNLQSKISVCSEYLPHQVSMKCNIVLSMIHHRVKRKILAIFCSMVSIVSFVEMKCVVAVVMYAQWHWFTLKIMTIITVSCFNHVCIILEENSLVHPSPNRACMYHMYCTFLYSTMKESVAHLRVMLPLEIYFLIMCPASTWQTNHAFICSNICGPPFQHPRYATGRNMSCPTKLVRKGTF